MTSLAMGRRQANQMRSAGSATTFELTGRQVRVVFLWCRCVFPFSWLASSLGVVVVVGVLFVVVVVVVVVRFLFLHRLGVVLGGRRGS